MMYSVYTERSADERRYFSVVNLLDSYAVYCEMLVMS